MKHLLRSRNLIIFAWVQALAAVAGSLYFSNVEMYLPCDLCWWQRVAVYPHVILFAVALYKKDSKIYRYSIPLLTFGWAVSLYHNILYYTTNFLNDGVSTLPCSTTGASCSARYFEFLGFVTIPLLSFISISVMIACMLVVRANEKNATK